MNNQLLKICVSAIYMYWFDLILYLPVNSYFSVMSGLVFLGWTRTRQKLSCSRIQCSVSGEAGTGKPLDLESSALPLSYCTPQCNVYGTNYKFPETNSQLRLTCDQSCYALCPSCFPPGFIFLCLPLTRYKGLLPYVDHFHHVTYIILNKLYPIA